jgi:hypothetical protein
MEANESINWLRLRNLDKRENFPTKTKKQETPTSHMVIHSWRDSVIGIHESRKNIEKPQPHENEYQVAEGRYFVVINSIA